MPHAPNETGARVIRLLRLLTEPSEFGFTRAEIIQRIDLYREPGMSPDAQRKMLEHDLAALRVANITIQQRRYGQIHYYKVIGVIFMKNP